LSVTPLNHIFPFWLNHIFPSRFVKVSQTLFTNLIHKP
jgi:hypothetical protein